MADPAFNTLIPNEDDYLEIKINGSTTIHPDSIQTVTSSFGVAMAFVGMALVGWLVVSVLATGIINGIMRCRRGKMNGVSRDEESAQPKPEDKLLNNHDSNHNQDSNKVDSLQPTRMLTDETPWSLHETSF